MIQLLTISVIILAVGYLAYRYSKTRPAVLTEQQRNEVISVGFVNSYCRDSTEEEFVNMPVEKCIERGQELLWNEAEVFGRHFSECMVNPNTKDLNAVLASALKIVKCVHTMHVVQNAGPLYTKPAPAALEEQKAD